MGQVGHRIALVSLHTTITLLTLFGSLCLLHSHSHSVFRTYPGFTLLATFGYSSYLLFYATQRFTLLWLLLTLESAVIHLSIISQIQILYTDRSGRFEEICRDQQQREFQAKQGGP